ncbi:UNVERIFIED_CONTAM: hypothetical protein HDU68_005552 [Siphonaria sp. JEL0065]|nr:hypothetical protein HDU68_005552 [Siphonaria sp. JEL0065]
MMCEWDSKKKSAQILTCPKMKRKQTNTLTNYFTPVPDTRTTSTGSFSASSPTSAKKAESGDVFHIIRTTYSSMSSSSPTSFSCLLPVPAKRWKGKEREERADALVSIDEDNDTDMMTSIVASRQSLRAYELGGGSRTTVKVPLIGSSSSSTSTFSMPHTVNGVG